MLAQMQAAGVRIALDDFGSARSSLAACKRWQLNTLKIDRSFVHGIGNDEGGTDIVAAVIHLARRCRCRWWRSAWKRASNWKYCTLGCHTCQGALFYPPLPAAGLLEQASGDFNTQTLPSNEE
jgi:EAL domain-containing protein (putative c-di-GMP-specific phosphodiesterase class I)